ncbi:MAG: hypothetical protein R2761_12465 [Acidimicrobiales bacterium]
MPPSGGDPRARDAGARRDLPGERPDPLAGLREALDRVCREHGLSRRELMAYQRAVHALQRVGQAPTPDEFWAATAQPRAQRLLDAARAAIDAELEPLARSGARVSAGDVAAALPSTADIDELGQWWQRRLRRAATLRALPDVAARLPGAAELTIAHHEMGLLDQPPWSHGDRLLSAFELAHAEIRRHGREQARRWWPVQPGRPMATPELLPV